MIQVVVQHVELFAVFKACAEHQFTPVPLGMHDTDQDHGATETSAASVPCVLKL